jgi:hypothetical protein
MTSGIKKRISVALYLEYEFSLALARYGLPGPAANPMDLPFRDAERQQEFVMALWSTLFEFRMPAFHGFIVHTGRTQHSHPHFLMTASFQTAPQDSRRVVAVPLHSLVGRGFFRTRL